MKSHVIPLIADLIPWVPAVTVSDTQQVCCRADDFNSQSNTQHIEDFFFLSF